MQLPAVADERGGAWDVLVAGGGMAMAAAKSLSPAALDAQEVRDRLRADGALLTPRLETSRN